MAKIKKGSAAPVAKGKSSAQQGKGKRIQTQPPGYPQGVHDAKISDACRCGRCMNKLLGR